MNNFTFTSVGIRRIGAIAFFFVLCLSGCSLGKGVPHERDPVDMLQDVLSDNMEFYFNNEAYAITGVCVADINADQLPEIILTGVDGWAYQIYQILVLILKNSFIRKVRT